MSMTVAMLFLIEATGVCGPVAPARLGGGAEVVRAILDVEEQPPDLAAPTLTGWRQSTGAVPGKTGIKTNDADSDPAPARCKPAPTPIA